MELATSYLKQAHPVVTQAHRLKGTRMVTPGLHMRQAGAINTTTLHRLTYVQEFFNAGQYLSTDRNFVVFKTSSR
jgi:hypothetical protein